MCELNLTSLEEICQETAREAFVACDGAAFAMSGYSTRACLTVVCDNYKALISRGMFESALVAGFTGGKTNNSHIPLVEIERLFRIADPTKLRACGDKIPDNGLFTVYRGVSGRGPARRIRGFSWTGDLEVACSFAIKYEKPAVFEATVSTEEVLCYFNQRNEQEFIVQPSTRRDMKLTIEEIAKHISSLMARRRIEDKARFTTLLAMRNKQS